jgi:transcriptional regulator with XRE-family HTH domain
VAVVTVEPSDSPPVRFRGRVHIRIGPRRGIASAQEERILTEKRRARDTPFDVHPLGSATLADLDRVRFENEYLPSAFAPDVLEANERSVEQRLAVTKMVDAANTAVPTVLGVLVLGKSPRDLVPGAYVQFLRIAGRELGDPVLDELAVDGPVSELLKGIDNKLQSHNRTPAWPFCRLSITARNPRPGYPSALARLGDHVRARRLDLRLTQCEVATQIGVTESTICNREKGRVGPDVKHLPALVRFLDYNPLPEPTSFAERVTWARTLLGLSVQACARRLGVDPATLWAWETGRREPEGRRLTAAEQLVVTARQSSSGTSH